MAIRKFSICTKCWFKSGSKSFTLLTKKCELLHADSWEVEPLMPGRRELCFSSAFSFLHPAFPHTSLFPAALQWFLSQILRSPSFLYLFVGAHVCFDWHLHSYVFFFPLSLIFPCSSRNMGLAAFLTRTWFHTHWGHHSSLFLHAHDCRVVPQHWAERWLL